jgi:hypothetical protein
MMLKSQGVSGALLVAIAGVAIALLSLVWQVVSWRRTRKTKLRVELTAGVGGIRDTWALICRCMNDSSHGVFIDRVSVGDLSKVESPLLWMTAFDESDQKESLRPHEGREYYLDGEALVEAIDPTEPIRVVVHTDDGGRYQVESPDVIEKLAIVAVLREERDSSSDRVVPTKDLSVRAHEKQMGWIVRSMERDGIVQIDSEGGIHPVAEDVSPSAGGFGWRLSDRRVDDASRGESDAARSWPRRLPARPEGEARPR